MHLKRDVFFQDIDNDSILNKDDNCPYIANRDQRDSDNDGVGDVCDNCVMIPNKNQKDSDGFVLFLKLTEQSKCNFLTFFSDLVGNACDNNIDRDFDGIQDDRDNCVSIPNSDQLDTDDDGLGDACDSDIDDDGIPNERDNCRYIKVSS